MSTQFVVVGTDKPDVFSVTITDLDHHGQAGQFREVIGSYPPDLANIVAKREGVRRELPVLTYWLPK